MAVVKMPRAWNKVDEYAQRCATILLEPFREALMAPLTGIDAEAHWLDYQRRLGRLVMLMLLLGMASKRRALVGEGLVSPVPPQEPLTQVHDVAAFAGDDFRPRGNFLSDVNAFRHDVPDLQNVVNMLNGHAGRVARAVTENQRARSMEIIVRLVKRVVGAERFEVEGLTSLTREAAVEIIDKIGIEPVQTILETQMRTTMSGAFNAGGRETIKRNTEVVPVTMLMEVHDLRTRGNPGGYYPKPHKHWQMDGFCAPSDDPVWEEITPPNGWNCRATIRGLSIAEVRRRGWMPKDSTDLDRDALRREFAEQWGIIDRGEYPDPGFKAG